MEKLIQIATEFHCAIIKAKPNFNFPYSDFPIGCCKDTSWILQKYLHLNGIESSVVSAADYEHMLPEHHSWLEMKDVIIDLTYYQSGEEFDEIIVTKDRSLHKRFDREVRKYTRLYYDVYDDVSTINNLDRYYELVIMQME